jgi:hypothetical protein
MIFLQFTMWGKLLPQSAETGFEGMVLFAASLRIFLRPEVEQGEKAESDARCHDGEVSGH